MQPISMLWRARIKLRSTAETLDTKTDVYVISPAGKLLKCIPIAEEYITNNVGGPDMKTLCHRPEDLV
jgi:hypothetical protein